MKESPVGQDQATCLLHSELLISGEAIQRRIAEMAVHIDRAYRGRRIVVVGVLKGAVHFLSDLTRCLSVDQRLEFVRVATYKNSTHAVVSARPEVFSDFDVTGQDVLVVDDILDHGQTARAVRDCLEARQPRSIRWAILLVKDGAIERAGFRPDFIGFEIHDTFVVGYGLDYCERYRNVPDIYAFEESQPD